MNWVRSAAAVLAALMLLNFMDATFAQILVSVSADTPPTTEAAFLAIRNRTSVLVMMLVTHVMAALLVGYILGKIAGGHEVRHALAAATVITVTYIVAFVGNNVMLPPMWVRVVQLLVTPPALIAGAWVRGEARRGTQDAGPSRPKEPS